MLGNYKAIHFCNSAIIQSATKYCIFLQKKRHRHSQQKLCVAKNGWYEKRPWHFDVSLLACWPTFQEVKYAKKNDDHALQILLVLQDLELVIKNSFQKHEKSAILPSWKEIIEKRFFDIWNAEMAQSLSSLQK